MSQNHVTPDAWPLLMQLETACAYLDGMDPRTFRKVCSVKPVALSANLLRYRRPDLDAWAAGLPVQGVTPPATDDSDCLANRPTLDLEPPVYVDDRSAAVERARARARK